MSATHKIDETRLREMAGQGMTDKEIGIVVGLSRRHVNFLRNLFMIAPGTNPDKKPVPQPQTKVTISPANHPEAEGLPDLAAASRKTRLDSANDKFSAAMCGRGHTSLNIPRGPAKRMSGPPTQVNSKSAMANFETV